MFDDLRRAFKEAVDNFKDELNRDEIPEVVDRLLHQMQEEVTDAQAHLHTLDEQIKKALRMAELEEREAATCRRRESMADRIGDEETARVAREFAEKHEKGKSIQERKALALKEELEMKRGEVEEMLGKIKEARAKRASLSATSGRSSARGSLNQAQDLFDELDRMAEAMGDSDTLRRSEEDLLAELDEMEGASAPRRPSPEEEAEARLQELKRLMGRE